MSDFKLGGKNLIELSGIHGWVLFEKRVGGDWEECGMATLRKDAQAMRAIFEKARHPDTEFRLFPRAQIEALRLFVEWGTGEETREREEEEQWKKWDAYCEWHNGVIRRKLAEARKRKGREKKLPEPTKGPKVWFSFFKGGMKSWMA